MNKFCSNCGSEIESGIRFCQNCGEPVADAAPVNNAVPSAPVTPMSQMEQSAAQHGIHVAKPKGSDTISSPSPRQTMPVAQPIAQPVAQSFVPQAEPMPKVKKQKGSKKLFVPLVAVVMVAVLLVTGLIVPGWMKGGGGKVTKDSAVLTAENPVATAGGVTVDLGEWNRIDNDTELSVTSGEKTSDKEEGWQLEEYEISVGDMHQLDDFATIRIPYDESYFEKGQDPAKCLGAKYYNEEEKDWQDILCSVDTKAKELVIYTDHFSRFGAFYVANEGKRSAYINGIVDEFDSLMYTDISELTKFLSNDKSSAEKALDFGIMLMDKGFDYRDTYAYGLDYFTHGEGSDYLSGAIKNTNTNWLTILGYAAIAYNVVKMTGQTAVDGQADAELTLNTLHTAASTFVTEGMNSFTQLGSASLAVSMTGVFVASKMLTTMFQGADKFKTEDVDMIFNHYMEVYTNKTHKPITPMDWRQTVIDMTSKEDFDAKEAGKEIEERIMKEAESFFALGSEELTDIVIEIPNITFRRVPKWTEAQKKKVLDNYMNRMKSQVLPMVMTSVQEYHIKKAKQAMVDQLSKTKKFYNTKITINIKGDKSYADHIVRFAPLNDVGKQNIKNWTGKLNSKGTCKVTATLLSFFLAGGPHQLKVFKPGDNPDTAKPVTTASFIIATPTIDIELAGSNEDEDDVSKYVGWYYGTSSTTKYDYSKGKMVTTENNHVRKFEIRITDDGVPAPRMMGMLTDETSYKWDPATMSGSCVILYGVSYDGDLKWHFEKSGDETKLYIDEYYPDGYGAHSEEWHYYLSSKELPIN